MKLSSPVKRVGDTSSPLGALDEFPSESRPEPRRLQNPVVIAGALLCIAAIGAPALLWLRSTATPAEASTGSLTVESEPGAATVFVDGKASGTTPVSLTLNAGSHRVLLRRGERTQELSVAVARNVSTVHHVTWPLDSISVAGLGSLRVLSDGAVARVAIDGVERGATPVTIDDLAAGDHEVAVRGDGIAQRRTIRIESGATASFVIGGRTSPPVLASGWLSADTTIPLQILENGKLVGSTETERIMLPAGPHAFEFANAALGFSVVRSVTIAAGDTSTVAIPLPRATISVNAIPWAQVWLDDQPLGETPIGNVMATIGSHEVIFRHPQLGERRVTALVTLKQPARVAVDMRKAP